MRRLNFVSLLLWLSVLLAALSPVVVATARRELLPAATGDQGLDQARALNILSEAPEAAVKDAEETTRRKRMEERVNYRRFGTRKIPSSQARFGGRIPFTSDYGRIKRHPPKHN